MIRRIGVAIVAMALAGTGGVLLLSRRQAIAPMEPPSEASFPAESIARGETLAAAGHCASCHTRAGGQPFAGGYGVNTPFGIIYGTNITPDPKTGIGTWSLEAFLRAMREGVARDGSHLFPAFPYNAYTKLTDDDLQGAVRVFDDAPAGQRYGAGEHGSVPSQHPRSPGRMEDSFLQERTLPAQSGKERRMESRSLSG